MEANITIVYCRAAVVLLIPGSRTATFLSYRFFDQVKGGLEDIPLQAEGRVQLCEQSSKTFLNNLKNCSESPTDLIRIPLTRLSQDLMFREMKASREEAVFQRQLRTWRARFGALTSQTTEHQV